MRVGITIILAGAAPGRMPALPRPAQHQRLCPPSGGHLLGRTANRQQRGDFLRGGGGKHVRGVRALGAGDALRLSTNSGQGRAEADGTGLRVNSRVLSGSGQAGLCLARCRSLSRKRVTKGLLAPVGR